MGKSYFLLNVAVAVVIVAVLVATAPGIPGWTYTPIPGSSHSSTLLSTVHIEQVSFVGGDGITTLRGRLHHSKGNEYESISARPVIVMAHGIGLTQDCHLDSYIEAFVKEQFAVLSFDYASFGDSDGQPRHLVRPYYHIKDIEAAIQYLSTSNNNINASRIGLWGTSFGGGHQLMVAANTVNNQQQDSRIIIKAVVSMVPHLVSGMETILGRALWQEPFNTLKGLIQFLHFNVKWIAWEGLYHLGFVPSPWYLALAGPPGSASMMQNIGDHEGYMSLTTSVNNHNSSSGWKNAADGWSAWYALTYRPMNHIKGLAASNIPLLLIGAENDTLCPADHVVKVCATIKSSSSSTSASEVMFLEDNHHFDIYHESPLHKTIRASVEFYKKHL